VAIVSAFQQPQRIFECSTQPFGGVAHVLVAQLGAARSSWID
jgi:hypothetical protein